MYRTSKFTVLVLFIAFASANALNGQSGSGVVKGTVSDASSAVVQGARARLTNRDTNIAREAVSQAGGLFNFADVTPGPYTLEVEQSGFEKWSGTFTVQVGQTAVIDPTLAVGSLADTVVVNDAAPAITTEGMQVADVKDALRIHQLPLNGRLVSSLFTLTPGVENNGGGLRVNGLKVGAAEITQDGISLVDRFTGGIQRVQPGLDTVQEFRIETSSSSARYPRFATLTLITKSGTNDLHGTLFETFRNNADGLRARQRQDSNTSAKLIRNEFGVSAGGPIWIPKLYNGRDKTFWFVSYEGLRQRQSVFNEDYVATPAMFNGDFSNVFDNNGVQTHIYDPLTTNAQGIRTQFPGDIIPSSRISPIWKTLRSITHAPSSNADPFQGPNLDNFYPLKTDTNTFTTKGDHRFSTNDSLSARFTRSHYNFSQIGGLFGSPLDGLANAYGTGLNDALVYTGTLSETHVFTPTLLNEFLFAVNRNPNHQGTLADFTNWPQKLGLPNPFGSNGWPTICAGSFNSCWDANNVKDQHLTAGNVEDNVTWVKGKHSFAFGGRVRQEFNYVRELQQSQGSHDFGESWTALYDPAGDQAVPFTGV
nr:carboxypeptidase-like regulatory domain-containing protein [Acidobacteriota bacterium]